MLSYEEFVKVMKERSYFSKFKKMIDNAANAMKEKCIIADEEDIEHMHLVNHFEITYYFQKNEITIFVQASNHANLYKQTIILDSEIEEMKKLSAFLENRYTKKLNYFTVSFDKRDKYEGTTTIFVLQKKVDKKVLVNEFWANPEDYFNHMYRDLKEDLEAIGIECVDVSKNEDWSEDSIVD